MDSTDLEERITRVRGYNLEEWQDFRTEVFYIFTEFLKRMDSMDQRLSYIDEFIKEVRKNQRRQSIEGK